MTRRYRAFAVVLLSLLLLGMQSEGLRHALAHRAAALTAPDTPYLQSQNDLPCAECALLASGANALAGALPTLPAVSILRVLVFVPRQSTPQAKPAYYRSRAPPAFS